MNDRRRNLLIATLLLRCVHSLEDTGVCVDGVCGVGSSPTLERIRERRRARDDVSQGDSIETSSNSEYIKRIIQHAVAAHEAGRSDDALVAFSQLRQRQEDNGEPPSAELAEAEAYHGMIFAQQWRGEEALDCWKNAITIKEQLVSTTGELISSFEAFRGQVSMLIYKAAEQFSNAANNDMHDHAIHTNGRMGLHLDAAKLCNAVGDIDRATDHLESAVQLNPDHAEAMYVLGTLREKQGRITEAKSLMQTGIELQKGNVAGAMIAAARACEEKDLETCHRRFLIAYEYAYADNNLPAASLAVSLAISVLLQLHGEAGIAESRVIGKKAVSRGVLNAPLQVPGTLIYGLLPAKAYHDDSKAWPVVRALEEHASEIRNEILAAYRDGKFSDRYEYDSVADLPLRGHWGEINIIRQSVPQPKIVEMLPVTSRVVLSIPDAVTMIHGGSKVSVIDGGSLVRPHTGCCNSRLRVHFGITIPDNCGIIVDGEARTWTEVQCMVFDDSFVHSVWQNSTQVRIILIVDIWHPNLDESAREATLLDEEKLKRYRQVQRMMNDGSWNKNIQD